MWQMSSSKGEEERRATITCPTAHYAAVRGDVTHDYEMFCKRCLHIHCHHRYIILVNIDWQAEIDVNVAVKTP